MTLSKAQRGMEYIRRLGCRNPNCDNGRAPDKLMCFDCWKLVPDKLKDKVWSEYRKGLSNSYLEAVADAVESLA